MHTTVSHSLDLHQVIPSYLWPLLSLHYSIPVIILGIFLACSLIVALLIYFWYRGIQKFWKEEYTFLAVTPTERTLKSPHATNQLFTTLHSLLNQGSLKRSISLELVSSKEEGIRYILRVPSDEVSTIRKILLGYVPGVAISEISDYLPGKESLPENTSFSDIVTSEFRLKTRFVHPLIEQELLNQYDPIGNITTHMTKLGEGEFVALQLIATPVHTSTHGSLLEYTNGLQKKLSNNEDISDDIAGSDDISSKIVKAVVDFLMWVFEHGFDLLWSVLSLVLSSKNSSSSQTRSEKKKVKRISELSITKQQLFKTVGDKINQPLFEVTMRICVSTKDKEDTKGRVRGIVSAFDTFGTSHQRFILQKVSTQIIPFVSVPQLEKLHSLQLKHRFSLFGTHPILSVSELSSLYHFPNNNSTNTEDLLQVKSPQLAPPLSLKQPHRTLDIVFAKNRYGETEVAIGQILEERRRHTYIIGSSGSGKSTLILHMIYQDLVNGKGLAVIDYHGDLIHYILGVIPLERWKDVVLVDPSNYEHPVAVNILELKKGLTGGGLSQEKGWIVSNVISIFKRLSGNYWGPRLEHILRNTLLTALETEDPTIETIYKLLVKKTFRTPIVNALPEGMLKSFWKDEFEKLTAKEQLEHVTPITNKLSMFLTAEITYNMVSHHRSSIDFEDIMNNNKILLVDLSQGKTGDDNAFFIGSLLVGKLHLTALRRINIPEDERVDFFLYIDEFEYFATDYFTDIFSGARKYRLDIIIVHQHTGQISDKVFESITGNAGTTISFRLTGPADEPKLLPIFEPTVEPGQLKNLPTFVFYIKIHGIEPQDAFTGEIGRFSIKPSEETRQKIIKLSQDKYTVKVKKEKQKKLNTPAANKTEDNIDKENPQPEKDTKKVIQKDEKGSKITPKKGNSFEDKTEDD